MRAVDLIRNQSIIATIDLYDFFNNGVVTDNITLINGILLTTKKINEVVTYGAIEKPAIYELRSNETFRSYLLCQRIAPLQIYLHQLFKEYLDDGRKIIKIQRIKPLNSPNNGDIVFLI